MGFYYFDYTYFLYMLPALLRFRSIRRFFPCRA